MQQWYTCPRCQQYIQQGATPCPHCGGTISWGPVQAIQAPAPKKGNKVWIVLGVIGTLILLGVIVGQLSPKTTAIPTTPAVAGPTSIPAASTKVTSPVSQEPTSLIANWSGSGIKTTQTFTVTAPWKIDWKFTKDDSGILQIFIYKSGSNIPDVAANVMESGNDTSYMHQSGQFYLKINSFGGNWQVKVYD